MNKILHRLYYEPPQPTAYAGADKLVLATRRKYQPNNVIKWLEGQDSYTLHKQIRRRFPRRNYNVNNIDDVWEADLADVRAIKSYNDGYTYLLVVIDVLSKFAWVEPVIDKTSKNVAVSFERILTKSDGRSPICLQTDKGKEFVGREMQEFLRKRNIMYRVVRSPDVKAAIVERFNRTLKERLWRYFTHHKTKRYIEVLQKIVASYNYTRHSGIRMQPAAVTLYNAAEARENLARRYKNIHTKAPKYRVGDLVRVSRTRNVFAKGYQSGWTLELFKIIRIQSLRQPPAYILSDLADEEIEGFFYEEELSRVQKDLNQDSFEVEKVIKSVGKGKTKKYLVSWKGYPEKFNSWISASSLKKK